MPDTSVTRQTTAGNAHWRVCRLGAGLGEHAAAWDELSLRLFGGHPLLDSTFVGGLLRAFGNGRQYLCLLQQDGVAAGMCILQRGRFGAWRSFLPSQAQVGPTLLPGPQALPGLFAALPGAVNAIELLCHDPRYGEVHLDGPLPSQAMRHAVTINIPLVRDFEDYWKRRPKKLRDNLKRYLKRGEATGHALQYHMVSDADEMGAAVARYAALEGRGWKGREGTALGCDPAQLRFYTELLATHAWKGQSRVYELWAGDSLAASRLVVSQGGLVVALKTTHDEGLRDWAPGRLLMHRLIEDAFTRWPGRSLEFYTNATVDQMAWADEQRTIVHVSVYPGRLRATLAQARRLLRKRRTPGAGDAEAEDLAIDTVTVCSAVGGLSAAEAELLAAAEARHFQCGREWFDLFVRTVAPDPQCTHFASLRRGALAAAVLPVNLNPELGRLGGALGALSNFYTTLYAPALAPDTLGVDLVPIFDALRAQPGTRPALNFAPMDPRAPSYGVLRAGLRAAGYAVFDYFSHGNWYLPVESDWATYLAGRPGALRHTIRRMSRRLAAQGGRIEVVTRAEDLPRAVAAYERVYAKSWKMPEPVPAFMPELMAWCAHRGWLRLGLVWLGETPIAAQLWIVADGRAAIYKLAYDAAYANLAPGTVLSAHLMERVIDAERVREVDYLVGDDAYKRDWMTHRRERRGLVGYELQTWAGRGLALRAVASALARRWWPATAQPPISAIEASRRVPARHDATGPP